MEHGLLVENLLDLAHAPFTHTSTFARGWPVGRGQTGLLHRVVAGIVNSIRGPCSSAFRGQGTLCAVPSTHPNEEPYGSPTVCGPSVLEVATSCGCPPTPTPTPTFTPHPTPPNHPPIFPAGARRRQVPRQPPAGRQLGPLPHRDVLQPAMHDPVPHRPGAHGQGRRGECAAAAGPRCGWWWRAACATLSPLTLTFLR